MSKTTINYIFFCNPKKFMTYLIKSNCDKTNTINYFPLSFFLIFLGVKNLTDNFPLDKEKITQNDKEEIINNNQDSEEIEKKL